MKKRLYEALKPSRSYWALVGIVLFFLLPEIVAIFWGDKIKLFFARLAMASDDLYLQKIYHLLEDFGEVSYINIFLGVIFIIWFFYERSRSA